MPRPVRRKYPTSTIGIYKHNRDHLVKIARSMGKGTPVPEAFDRMFGQILAAKAAELVEIEKQSIMQYVTRDFGKSDEAPPAGEPKPNKTGK